MDLSQKFSKRFNIKFLILFGIVCLVSLATRIYVLPVFKFTPDNGTEFFVLSKIKAKECFPLIGPLLGIENIFLPATYFYLLYFVTLFTNDPNIGIYAFTLMNFLATVFLSLAIYEVTNKKIFFWSLVLINISAAVLTEGLYIWHPHPVILFFSLGLWQIVKARKTKKIANLLFGIISYLISLSIYLSALPLLPFFIVQTIYFYFAKTKNYIISIALMILTFVGLALPIYFSQLVFEYQTHFPTLRLILNPREIQNLSISIHLIPPPQNIVNLLNYFVKNNLGIYQTFTNSLIEIIVWIGLILWLILIGLKSKSYSWYGLFPNFLGLAFLCLAVFYDSDLPLLEAKYRFMPILFFWFFCFAELAFQLRAKKIAMFVIVLFMSLFVFNNLKSDYQLLKSVSFPEKLVESYSYKNLLSKKIFNYFNNSNLKLADTLILRKTQYAVDYNDDFNLQYYAMEFWTLLSYKSLIPKINQSCSQYRFYSKSEISQLANQIILIDDWSVAHKAPNIILDNFVKQKFIYQDARLSLILYTKNIGQNK